MSSAEIAAFTAPCGFTSSHGALLEQRKPDSISRVESMSWGGLMHRLPGEPLRGKNFQGGSMTAVTQAVVDHGSSVAAPNVDLISRGPGRRRSSGIPRCHGFLHPRRSVGPGASSGAPRTRGGDFYLATTGDFRMATDLSAAAQRRVQRQ